MISIKKMYKLYAVYCNVYWQDSLDSACPNFSLVSQAGGGCGGDDENRCGWKLNINSFLSCLFSRIEGYLKYHQISSDQMCKSSYQTEAENI